MQINVEWLQDYIDYQGTIEELDSILTKAGLEVEGIESFGEGLDGVIIGKVKSKEKHPDADKLSVCIVFDGKEDLQIVCGAPNIEAGQTIALAPVGCVLPDPENQKGFKIKKSKIRGIESLGMICAEDELGLSNDHDGIMILDDSFEAGTPITSALNLPKKVLDISITPNRPDCLSYIGVAREVSAATGLPVKIPSFEYSTTDFKSESFSEVTIEHEDCPRYMGLAVKNVKIKPSPKWLKTYLETVGLRSINNVVDITNFVMLESGNPLHAFDADEIKGKKIIIRKANENETMTTLDEQERKLLNTDLLICDESGPVALAGVMGGLNSEITENTTNVFIEVAYFNPICVRKTSRRLGLQTDSSFRFERGVDPENLEYVIKRTASLLNQLADGEVASNIIDIYPQKIEAKVFSLRTSRVNKVLGVTLTTSEVEEKLKGIDILKEENISEDELTYKIPTFRPDITREVDLIEEIARLIGFENIPYTLPKMSIKPITEAPIIKFTDQVKTAFVNKGFNETVSFHFTGLKDIEKMQLSKEDPRSNPIAVKNPIAEDLSHMQTTLIPNLLRAAALNANHFNESIQLFEVGRIYLKEQYKEELKSIFENRYYKINEYIYKEEEVRPIERAQVAGIITGINKQNAWNEKEDPHSFYSLKGLLISTLSSLKIKNIKEEPLRNIDTYLHPGKSITLKANKVIIGYLGQLKPEIAEGYGLKSSPFVFELDVPSLLRCQNQQYQFNSISKFPSTNRDLSFAFRKETTWGEIENSIKKLNIKHLQNIHVFDLFEGGNLAEDQKSLAISLTFQSNEKTLEEKDTQKSVDKVTKLFIEQFEATQR
ncbi:MAG: phenylalanine--tRNA ligase subunit beta [Planctomycetota bacterium]|nr:MAG: phenylalanine--tRNA ligase subunit beta [Planctomycetota bacterium]